MSHYQDRQVYGPRPGEKAKQELAELAKLHHLAKGPKREAGFEDRVGGGWFVTFTKGESRMRCFVWASCRAAALNRALSLPEVANWLPENTGADAYTMSAGLQPRQMAEYAEEMKRDLNS